MAIYKKSGLLGLGMMFRQVDWCLLVANFEPADAKAAAGEKSQKWSPLPITSGLLTRGGSIHD